MSEIQVFYAEGNERRGPFTLSQIASMGLPPTTLVWYNGLSDWTPISQAPCTSPFYVQAPPQPPYQQPAPAYAPGYGYQGAPPRPDNYMVWAILATLFCCLPFGIVSIIYAAKVSGLYDSGNYDGALNASRKAKQWAIWSALSAVIFIVLYFFLIVLAGMSL